MNRVISFSVKSAKGIRENSGMMDSPMPSALLVTMKPSRKPRPVALTTPTTMPIAAQTAPTDKAYFTPCEAPEIRSPIPIRWAGLMKPTIRTAVMPQKAAICGE